MIFSSEIRKPRGNSGFSLVELAIVIGVSTVILAGIWAVVSNVRQNVRVEQAAQQITSVMNGVRALYQGRPQITGAAPDLTNSLIEQGAIPIDMRRPGTASPNNQANHPWGGNFQVAAADATSFYIILSNLSERSCIAMAAKVASVTGTTGFMGVAVNGNALTLPVSVPDADVRCASTNTNTVRYQFRLRQPNS